MPTRRMVLGMVAGASLELAAGCKTTQPVENPPNYKPSLAPAVLELGDLKVEAPRPTEVTLAAKATVRIVAENNARNFRKEVSGIRVARGLLPGLPDAVLSVESLRRFGADNEVLYAYQAELALARASGSLAVMRAIRAGMFSDRVTNAALLEITDPPAGPAATRLDTLAGSKLGDTLHLVGFGESRAPLKEAAPKAGLRLALLSYGTDLFYGVTAHGPGEGESAGKEFTPAMAGGPIFNPNGLLVGMALNAQRVKVSGLLGNDAFGNAQRITTHGKDEGADTSLQLITCQVVDGALLSELNGIMGPISAPSR